jgi:hypothetical protein
MKSSQPKTSRFCPNCHFPLPGFGKYCSHCGQKYTDGKITVAALISEFIHSVLNIDAKFFLTLRALFIPGKLTEAYFKGQQKRYAPPVRLFFVMAVIHFAVLGYVSFNALTKEVTKLDEGRLQKAHYADFRDSLDVVRQQIEQQFPDRVVSQSLDSLERLLPDTRQDSSFIGYLEIDSTGKWSIELNGYPTQRVVEAPIDSLISESGVSSFIGKTTLRQSIRANREGGDFIRYVLGKLIWMVVLMMPALALVLQLLYVRHDHYYVEHLVFAFHYHAFAFLIISAVLIIPEIEFFNQSDNLGTLLLLGVLAILIYLFIAMKRYYQQGWIKTFIKYYLVNVSYVFIFSLFLFLTSLVSALLF